MDLPKNHTSSQSKRGLHSWARRDCSANYMNAQTFAKRLIDTATNFVGLRETESNAAFNDLARSKKLIASFKRVKWWASGAAYCAAFDGGMVALTADALELDPSGFLKHWTAHCMTNVRKMKELGYLSARPAEGALWLAKHGDTDSGHAGIVVSFKGGVISTIEGNTSSGSTGSQRNGDGIFARTRDAFQNGNLKTMGFVHPEAILKMMGALSDVEFIAKPKPVKPDDSQMIPILGYLERTGRKRLLAIVLKMPGAVYDKTIKLTVANPAAIERYIASLG